MFAPVVQRVGRWIDHPYDWLSSGMLVYALRVQVLSFGRTVKRRLQTVHNCSLDISCMRTNITQDLLALIHPCL